jgi:sec-independent protein translocase protein TatC
MLKKMFKNNPEMAEMSFFDHLEELRWHIVRSLFAVLVGTVVVFIKINLVYDGIIMAPTRHTFITYRVLCSFGHFLHLGDSLCLPDVPLEFQSMKLSGQFMQALSSSFTFGAIIAAPYILWEFWRFVRPALKEEELKYTRGVVFWTSLLFFTGIGFGYFIIAPYTVNFFGAYSISKSIHNIITIQSYLSTLSQVVVGCGVLFELPIFAYFLAKVGILNPAFLKKYRKHAFLIILIVAAFITPPDVASQVIVTIPLYLLYELSIRIARRVERQKQEAYDKEWS